MAPNVLSPSYIMEQCTKGAVGLEILTTDFGAQLRQTAKIITCLARENGVTAAHAVHRMKVSHRDITDHSKSLVTRYVMQDY